MEDLNFLYSPSRWSSRLPADVIVDNHAKVLRESKSVVLFSI